MSETKKNPVTMLQADKLLEYADRGTAEAEQVGQELLRRARIKAAAMRARADAE